MRGVSVSQISREAGALSVGVIAICVGEISGGTQIAGIALINLAAIWRDLKSQCSNRTRREAEAAVRAALEASREFRDDDLATAAALLDSMPRDLTFEPARTADLLGEDRFVTDTAAELVRLLQPDPQTPAIGRILTLALEAGLRACAASDEFRAEMAWDISLSTLQAIVRVERRMFDLTDAILAQHADLRASYEATLIQMARRIAMDVEDWDGALAELDRAVGIVQRLEIEGHRPSNHPDFIDAVFAQVAELNRENEMDAAAEALQAALDREMEETVARQVKLLDGLISQHTLRRDIDGVIKAELGKLALEGGGFEDLRSVRNLWYERGRDKVLRFDLEVAIGLARAEVERGRNFDERGIALDDLGVALATLGERENGAKQLEAAAETFRLALTERSRARVPLDWAKTMMNLGSALYALGRREIGTARLTEAFAAFHSALEEQTRDKVPLDWAMTQGNLGLTLAELGRREKNRALLVKAVTAYQCALQERPRERVPMEWAMTQNNLGNALATLAQLSNGTAPLEEAIAAYRDALKEWTREKVPLDWAMTQNNICNALTTLGRHEKGTERLDEAISACRLALEERTRDRAPLDWAMSQHCLSVVETEYFCKTGDKEWLDAAREHSDLARGAYAQAGADHYVDWIDEQIEWIEARRPARD